MGVFSLLQEGVAASGLIVAVSGACPVTNVPDIDIRIRNAPTEINHTMTKQELSEARTDKDMPYRIENFPHTDTGGLMRGDIKIQYDINLEQAGTHCLAYSAIVVTMTLHPEIFIASEYDTQSCLYREVYEHEQSHVDIDRLVMGKYADRLRDGLALAFSGRDDAVQGPFLLSEMKEEKGRMGRQATEMANMILADMKRERLEKQQVVDSPQGYIYIARQCQHEIESGSHK